MWLLIHAGIKVYVSKRGPWVWLQFKNPTSTQILLYHLSAALNSVLQSLWNFAQNMAGSLFSIVHNCKVIKWLKGMLWMDRTLQNFEFQGNGFIFATTSSRLLPFGISLRNPGLILGLLCNDVSHWLDANLESALETHLELSWNVIWPQVTSQSPNHSAIFASDLTTEMDEMINNEHCWNWYIDYDLKHISGFEHYCGVCVAEALEILQSCTKPSIWRSDLPCWDLWHGC